MNVKNIEKNENGKLTFQVEIDAKAFDAAVNKAYQQAKKDIMIPGFRKGKAPRAIVESMYGATIFYEDAVNEIAPDAYEEGLKQSEARVVGRPSITDFNVADDKSCTLDFTVTLYPQVTLGQYKGLEIYKAPVEVTDEDVDKDLANTQNRNSRIVSVDRAAEIGDTVNIDYDGYKDGVRFDGGKDEGFDLKLGSHSFVPGFEEQIVGMVAGEEKDLDITFPENYHEGLAGAAVVFKVKVNEVKETQLPILDDDFAKDVSEFDTLDEYKASIKENILKRKTEDADRNFKNDAIDAAGKNMTVEIPAEMVDDQVDNMIAEYRQSCAMQGMTFEQYIGMMGIDEATFRGYLRPQAEAQTRGEVLLEAVAEAEAIEISEEDLEAEYAKAAENYGVEIERVKASVSAEMITRDLKMSKAADVIAASAVATDVKPEEPAAEAAETEAE